MRRCNLVLAAVVGLAAAWPAGATTFDLDGIIEVCVPLVCDLAGLGVGDPLTGFIVADPAAAGPDSSFGAGDILDYQISVNDVSAGAADSNLDSASLSTDSAGEIAGGSVVVSAELDAGPPVGLVPLVVSIDATNGTWEASTTLLGLGVVASGGIAFALAPDTDGDGIADAMDNCIEAANPGQQDTDSDFYGNACDTDLNNDGNSNFGDLALFKQDFLGTNPDTDFNSDGNTNFGDLAVFKARFLTAPGPSGTVPAAVTYTDDVQPIFADKCAPCHTGLGFGGHNIGTMYTDAFLPATNGDCAGLNIGECTILRIQSGDMPNNAGCSGDPAQDAGNAACLTQAEQDTIQAWIDGGLAQ